MKLYFIKSPFLLVLSLVVPSYPQPTVREAHKVSAVKAAGPDACADKGWTVSVDGIVELY